MEQPSGDSSIYIAEDDRERLRGMAGISDPQRIRLIREGLEEISEFSGVSPSCRIQISSEDKDWIESHVPGDTWAVRFHSFVRSLEVAEEIDLREIDNYMVR